MLKFIFDNTRKTRRKRRRKKIVNNSNLTFGEKKIYSKVAFSDPGTIKFAYILGQFLHEWRTTMH